VGIYFAHFLILGGLGETDETLAEGFENSQRINNTVFFPFIGMRIYPGTELELIARQAGVISAGDDLMEPRYYLSGNVDLQRLKAQARQTGKRWIFPDEDLSGIMQKMRARNKKGPLWEYLVQ